MDITVRRYDKTLVDDVVTFELSLREEEDFWGWEIGDTYIKNVRESFDDPSFDGSVSLLAYVDGKVVGRIDSSLIRSHFDGSTKAYLDWICVLKSPSPQGRCPGPPGFAKKRIESQRNRYPDRADGGQRGGAEFL
ncbi:MAG: hypothetical protein Q4F15_05405 [Bacillota bacterium]|nr:hypothetical protein [Bacillota bacterium]